jgi:PAS domain S-box-containing protein
VKHAWNIFDKAAPAAVSSRVKRAANYLEDGIRRLQVLRDESLLESDAGRVQAEKALELQEFIDNLPEPVYELRLFRADITPEQREEILRYVEEIRRASENELDAVVEKVWERLAQYVDGVFLYANRKAEDLLGIALNGSGKVNMAEIVAPEYLTVALKNGFKLLNKKTISGLEYKLITSDRKKIYVRVSATLADAVFPFVIRGIAQNITERKRINNKKNKQRKIIAIQKRKNAQLRTAYRVLRTMADFFSQVLPVLYGGADLAMGDLARLKRGVEGLDSQTDALQESLNSMFRETERLVRVVDQVKDFTDRAELQPLELTDVNVLVGEAIRQVGQTETRISFIESSGLSKIQSNQKMIRDALSFFIKSAVDADARAGKGFVIVRVREQKGEIEINIFDRGKRHEDLSTRLLRNSPFVHGKTYLYEEYLQLSLALKYIEAHGGRCVIKSDSDAGSLVSIWLPIEAK